MWGRNQSRWRGTTTLDKSCSLLRWTLEPPSLKNENLTTETIPWTGRVRFAPHRGSIVSYYLCATGGSLPSGPSRTERADAERGNRWSSVGGLTIGCQLSVSPSPTVGNETLLWCDCRRVEKDEDSVVGIRSFLFVVACFPFGFGCRRRSCGVRRPAAAERNR